MYAIRALHDIDSIMVTPYYIISLFFFYFRAVEIQTGIERR